MTEERLTESVVQQRANSIRIAIQEERGDESDWHKAEDELYRDVLEAIWRDDALTAEDARALAGAALVVRHLDFARWYA